MHHITTLQASVNTLGAALSLSLIAPVLALFPEYTPLVAISGLAGGVSRWLALQQSFWPTGLGSILTGGLCAIFLFPAVHALFADLLAAANQDPRQALMTGGYLAGLLGMALILWILDLFSSRSQRLKGGDDDAQP